MSKRDGEFAKTKTDWHRDPRCRALKHPSYKWLNQVLWNLCVKERRERLPSYYTAATLAHEADIDVRTARKGLALMSQECIGLITINLDETITVHGVRAIHENKKFRFLEDEQLPRPPRGRVEKRESRVEKRESKKSVSADVQSVFDHHFKTFKKNGNFKLSPERIKVIEKALKIHGIDNVIKAIDAMGSDDWEDRAKFNDLHYAIGMVKGQDKVEYWASYEPLKKKVKFGLEKDKNYAGPTIRSIP